MKLFKKLAIYIGATYLALLAFDFWFVKVYGQTPTQALSVVIYSNITAANLLDRCDVVDGDPCIDNRSQFLRQSSITSYRAVGTGAWSVDMQFSDGNNVSWVSFGSTGQVSNTGPASGVGYGIGPAVIAKPYHDYIRFVITGNATILNYNGTRQFWWLPSVASIAFPITSNQGGTGSASIFNGVTSAQDAANWATAVSSLSNGNVLILPTSYQPTITAGATVSVNNVTINCQAGSSVTAGYNGPTLTVTGSGFTMIGNCNFLGGEAAHPTWVKPVVFINAAPFASITGLFISDQANHAGSGNYGIHALCSHDFTLNYANVQASGTVLGSDGAVSIQADGCTGGASSDNTKILNSFIMLPYNADCAGALCGDALRVDADTLNGMTNDNGVLSGTTIIDGGSRFGAEFFGSSGSRNTTFIPLKGWAFTGDNFQIIGQNDDAMLSLTTMSGLSMSGLAFNHNGFYSGVGTVEWGGVQNSSASAFSESNCSTPIANFIPDSITVDTSGNHNTLNGLNMPCGDYRLEIFNASNEVGESDDIISNSTFAARASGSVSNGSAFNLIVDSCCTVTREIVSNNHFICQMTNGLVSTISLLNSGGLINHITLLGNSSDGCAVAYNNSSFSDPAVGVTNISGLLNDWNVSISQFVQSMGQSAWTDLTDLGFPEKHSQSITAPHFFTTGTTYRPTACTTGTGLDGGGVSCASGLRGPGLVNGTQTAYSGTLTWTTVSPSTGRLFTLTMPSGAFGATPICSVFSVYTDPLVVLAENMDPSTTSPPASATSISFVSASVLPSGHIVSIGWDCKCNGSNCPVN